MYISLIKYQQHDAVCSISGFSPAIRAKRVSTARVVLFSRAPSSVFTVCVFWCVIESYEELTVMWWWSSVTSYTLSTSVWTSRSLSAPSHTNTHRDADAVSKSAPICLHSSPLDRFHSHCHWTVLFLVIYRHLMQNHRLYWGSQRA